MTPLLCLLMGGCCLPVAQTPISTDSSCLYQPAFAVDHELRSPAVPYVPQPGDIFLCTGQEMWAKVGHRLADTAAPQHSGIVFARPDGSMALLEAGPNNTLHVSSHDVVPQLATYWDHERIWIRRRNVPLTAEQSAALSAFACAVEGKRFALVRMLAQITPCRCRGRMTTQYFGGPHGTERWSYFCSELVAEACVAARLLDEETTRPAAMYPRELFFGHSDNPWINDHLDMSQWDAPARWTLQPGSEKPLPRMPWLDGDTQ